MERAGKGTKKNVQITKLKFTIALNLTFHKEKRCTHAQDSFTLVRFFLQRPFMALLLAMLVADDDDDDNGVSSVHFALCEVYF